MSIQIALLRGINVGGHNKLPMAGFRTLLEGLGVANCKTYIQSGNAVWCGNLTEKQLAEAIEIAHGFRPRVMIRTRAFWDAAIAENPFPTNDPKALHLFVMGGSTAAIDDDMNAQAGPSETAHLGYGVVYLHTPGGLSASKLAPRIDRLLGIPTTARNWRSVLAIHDLAASLTP